MWKQIASMLTSEKFFNDQSHSTQRVILLLMTSSDLEEEKRWILKEGARTRARHPAYNNMRKEVHIVWLPHFLSDWSILSFALCSFPIGQACITAIRFRIGCNVIIIETHGKWQQRWQRGRVSVTHIVRMRRPSAQAPKSVNQWLNELRGRQA